MTLAPPPIAFQQAVLDRVTTYSSRAVALNPDGSVWRQLDLAKGGSVTTDMARDERRTASMSIVLSDDMNIRRTEGLWYDKSIRVYLGVFDGSTLDEQAVGTFLIDDIARGSGHRTIKLNVRDYAKKLSYELPYAVEWPKNTPVENVVSDLASGGGVGPSQQNLPLTGLNTAEIQSFPEGRARWTAMREVANAYGYDVFFDPLGILTMEPFTDPYLSAPEYRFEAGVASNLHAIDRKIQDTLIRNHIVVRGERPDGVPVWGEAINTSADSPTNVGNLGYRTETIESSFVESSEQAREMAERRLKYTSLEQWTADITTPLVPWMDVNTTVELHDPNVELGSPVKYLLNRFTLSLDFAPSKARLARVTDVSAHIPLYPGTAIYPGADIYPTYGEQ